jgi:NAD-dependent deacetylase
MNQAATNDDIATIAGMLREARYAVMLTGAGISTESGIPDFRGPQGVWTKDPAAEKQATLQHYMGSREVRIASWQTRTASPMWDAQPNPGHEAVAELERRGVLHFLVTQNVDGLHGKAGFPKEKLVEIHGNIREYVCMQCGDRGPMGRVLDRVRAGEEDPPCRQCGGILKSAGISFGQSLVASDLERSQEAAMRCDLMIAAGTTLAVYPAAGIVPIALQRGARLVILNAQETPFDEYASVIVREPLGEVLPAILAAL